MSDVSWGLDLAGFSTGKSALARAEKIADRKAKIEIYLNHPFMIKVDGRDTVANQLAREKSFVSNCDQLYIDMPIDLQSLPLIASPVFSWQLTKRPIDFAYSAMPPFAERIGSPVARLQAILSRDLGKLGIQYFETYPAMSLAKWFGRTADSYKHVTKTAEWDGDRWVGDSGLAELMNLCGFVAKSNIHVNDDQFDACLCAIVGVVDSNLVLADDDLNADVARTLKSKIRKADAPRLQSLEVKAPKGYRILKTNPSDWSFEIALVDVEPSP